MIKQAIRARSPNPGANKAHRAHDWESVSAVLLMERRLRNQKWLCKKCGFVCEQRSRKRPNLYMQISIGRMSLYCGDYAVWKVMES